jgi:hypothetical protein
MQNMQNYLIKSLAIVGTISLIIMACSADDANNTNSTASTNAVGKYQISSYSNVLGTGGSLSVRYIDVIDTETGIVKSYSAQPNSNVFVLKSTTSTQ